MSPNLKEKNYYFNKDTQLKLEEYQNALTQKEKDLIYVTYIMPAFEELVTKLISVYKYTVSCEDIDHLKNDCVTFLFETIHKWKPDKGKKAFSYFNVVAKNWLTIQTRKINKNSIRSVGIDNIEEMTVQEKDCLTIVDVDYESSPEDILMSKETISTIIFEIEKISLLLSKENDKKCVYAILHVFKNIETLELFNKRAVFVYLREISGLDSSELSSSLSRIRRIWNKLNMSIDFFV